MIRVMVVDDSAVMRAVLRQIIDEAADMEVVALAADPYFARDKLKQLNPDVLTLDVEMPRMDGLTFLEKLMNYRPMPVVMVSSLTSRGADTTLRALALGAVDFVTKPPVVTPRSAPELADEVRRKIRAAAMARVRGARSPRAAAVPPSAPLAAAPSLAPESVVRIDDYYPPLPSRPLTQPRRTPLVAIGASTGGTVAVELILTSLPADSPGIVIVQHMPEAFTRPFADRLNGVSRVTVAEAADGMTVSRGQALVARGGSHLEVHRRGSSFGVSVKSGPPINRHRPSVDVLFRSAAAAGGSTVLGVLLTGMGDDGARGLLDLRQIGADTIAQSEESCVVFGMPKVAIDMGAACRVVPLSRIADAIREYGSRYRQMA